MAVHWAGCKQVNTGISLPEAGEKQSVSFTLDLNDRNNLTKLSPVLQCLAIKPWEQGHVTCTEFQLPRFTGVLALSRNTRAKRGSQEAYARDRLVFGSLLGQIFL